MKTKKYRAVILLLSMLMIFALTSCKSEENNIDNDVENNIDNNIDNPSLPDGEYLASFNTDSSMFRVNEANEGKGILTIENGEMTLHVSLVSKNIVNLFVGRAEDAKKPDAILLNPTNDTVTYSDGISEEVYGFDIPISIIDEEFDLALIGKKGVWYDHKVSVSDPVLSE